jgi:hypothetical protein
MLTQLQIYLVAGGIAVTAALGGLLYLSHVEDNLHKATAALSAEKAVNLTLASDLAAEAAKTQALQTANLAAAASLATSQAAQAKSDKALHDALNAEGLTNVPLAMCLTVHLPDSVLRNIAQ